MDDPRMHDYNKDSKIRDFIKAVEDQAQHYATNNIIMTMGSDFQYTNARVWYKNLDKLIKYVNALQNNRSCQTKKKLLRFCLKWNKMISIPYRLII